MTLVLVKFTRTSVPIDKALDDMAKITGCKKEELQVMAKWLFDCDAGVVARGRAQQEDEEEAEGAAEGAPPAPPRRAHDVTSREVLRCNVAVVWATDLR